MASSYVDCGSENTLAEEQTSMTTKRKMAILNWREFKFEGTNHWHASGLNNGYAID
jgi:hypothetical protein